MHNNNKPKLIPVEGSPGLYRDSTSGAIINKNTKAAQNARKARENALRKDQELEELKEEVLELKVLLQKLLDKMD